MKSNLTNVFYACTAQPGRIVLGKRSVTTCLSLFGLSMFLLGMSDSIFGVNLWPMLIFSLLCAIYVGNKEASLTSKKQFEEAVDKILFVTAYAPIPSVFCYVIEADIIITLAMMLVCCYTILHSGSTSPAKDSSGYAPSQNIDQGMDAQALRKLRATSQDAFVSMGPSIGSFADREIPAWFIDATGVKHNFVGICPTTPTLQPGQSFVSPGLIYSEEAGKHSAK